MTDTQYRCAILGASGYTGAELVRLLSLHPNMTISALSADRKAGQNMSSAFPHLMHLDLPTLCTIGDIDFSAIDLVFCALPHALTQEVVRDQIPANVKIVDLSADFRLESPDAYEQWYGGAHLAQELQKEAVFGLPEYYRDDIAKARLVANTGCYVATSLLPLLPLLQANLIDTNDIVIDAASGVSGAGRAPKEGILFCEINDGYHAYGVGAHRHVAELDQEFTKAAGRDVICSFTPHLLPQARGILATCYVKGNAEDIHAELTKRYKDEYFIHVLPMGATPQTRHVKGSNFCHIGVAPDRIEGRTIVISALDNLVRGASGQAIQNANIMLGLAENTGLQQAPLFP